MSSLRIAVIGIGNMGSAHARHLFDGKITNASLAAVCDISPARLNWAAENLPDIPRFERADDLFSANIADAVLIATPHYAHAPIAIAAFEAGLHVLTEKPETVRLSDALAMNEAADRSGKTFGIMFNQRTNELFRKAKELVESGALGTRRRLDWVVTNWYRTQAYYDSGSWRGSWQGEGGGVLLNQAPHNLDLMQWIFGMPSSLRATCREGAYHHIEVEDEASLEMTYSDGATARFFTSTGEFPGTNRLEIVGDLGKIVIEQGVLKYWSLSMSEKTYRFASKDASGKLEASYSEFTPCAPESGHIGVLQAFVDAILTGTPLIADGHEGVHMLSLANAAYLSSWTGRAVDLPFSDEAMNTFNTLLSEKCARGKEVDTANASPFADGKLSPRWKVNW